MTHRRIAPPEMILGPRIEIKREAGACGEYFCPEGMADADVEFGGFAVWEDGFCFGFRRTQDIAVWLQFAHIRFRLFDLIWRLYQDATVKIHNGKRWIWPKWAVESIDSPSFGFGRQVAGKNGTYFNLCVGGQDKCFRLFTDEYDVGVKRHQAFMSAKKAYLENKTLADSWKGPYKVHEVVEAASRDARRKRREEAIKNLKSDTPENQEPPS